MVFQTVWSSQKSTKSKSRSRRQTAQACWCVWDR